jgi:hypothetical protein
MGKYEEDEESAMPMRRKDYANDWEAISASIRERAGDRCEWPGCGIANRTLVMGKRGRPYKIVLTCAHVDHDTHNNDPSNLRAWCQTHHLRHDAQQHARNAARTRTLRQTGQLPERQPELWHDHRS